MRRFFSQCSGLIRRGATRLTSDLESCGTPRGDSTDPSLSDLSVVAGDGGGSENTLGVELGFRAESSRILGTLSERQPQASEFVQTEGTKKLLHQDLNSVDGESFHRVWLASRHVAPQAKMMRTDNADRVRNKSNQPSYIIGDNRRLTNMLKCGCLCLSRAKLKQLKMPTCLLALNKTQSIGMS